MIEIATIILCILQVVYLITVIASFGHRKVVPAPVIASRPAYLTRQIRQD